MAFSYFIDIAMDDKTLKAFGQQVRKIRLSQGVSQERLGLLAELDRTYISGIERGLRNISLINIIKLASALNIQPSELLNFGARDHA